MKNTNSAQTTGAARVWAIALTALSLFCALLASTTPSPLYPVYLVRFSLNHGAVSLIFSIYAVGTLATLIGMGRFGHLIVHKRTVIIAGLLLSAIGAIGFALSTGLYTLLLGRFLSGVATGLITNTATAVLFELEREHDGGKSFGAMLSTVSFTMGAALGPVLASAAIAAELAPTVTPFAVITALSILLCIGLAIIKWPVTERDDIDALNTAADRVDTKSDAGKLIDGGEPIFLLACIGVCIAWAVGSLLMASGVEIGVELYGISTIAIAGLLITAYQFSAGSAQFLLGGVAPKTSLMCGLGGLAAMMVLFVSGAFAHAPWALIIAMPVCGVAYGSAFVGATGLVKQCARKEHQLKVISRFYFIAYLSNAIPVLGFGALVDIANLFVVFIGFCIAIFALSVMTILFATKLRVRPD